VALAHLLGETRVPSGSLWQESLVSSRLLEYEMWVRVNARGLTRTHGDEVRSLLGTVALLELSPLVLARAVEPFPVPVRTLDALHLASMIFLQSRGEPIALTTYDERLARAASALGVSVIE
jgi:predicted nucleic acid-binding protein